MSNQTNNAGGPAFPCRFTNDSDLNISAPDGQVLSPGASVELPGISLRDYLAAKVMLGIICASGMNGIVDYEDERVAKSAYLMADHMLAERSK